MIGLNFVNESSARGKPDKHPLPSREYTRPLCSLYKPKDWFSFIFRFHKADTVRALSPDVGYSGLFGPDA